MKIKTTNDLPVWFSLKQYRVLNEMSDEQVREQFLVRLNLYRATDDLTEIVECSEEEYFGSEYLDWESIKKRPIVSIESRKTLIPNSKPSPAKIDAYHRLAARGSVHGVMVHTAEHFMKHIYDKEVIKANPDDPEYLLYKQDYLLSDISMYAKAHGYSGATSGLYIELNIEEYCDEDIIKDVQQLLPFWRKQLSVDEPDVINQRKDDVQKIVNYQLIPLLDLLLWSAANRRKIPNSVMTVALFPNGEKGEVEFRQTVLPMLHKLLDYRYRGFN